MSVERVVARSVAPEMWATIADECFHCGEKLTEHELVVAWMPNSDNGKACWHARCAVAWGLAFMRDAWEITHANSHSDANAGKYGEPWAVSP